jgi:pimeloyl-ACP methyl ester carboxylesterase
VAPFYSGDRRIPHEEDDTVSYADVNGISLYYEEHGSGQPLVLLHGGLAAGSMYAPNLRLARAGRRGHPVPRRGLAGAARADGPVVPVAR